MIALPNVFLAREYKGRMTIWQEVHCNIEAVALQVTNQILHTHTLLLNNKGDTMNELTAEQAKYLMDTINEACYWGNTEAPDNQLLEILRKALKETT